MIATIVCRDAHGATVRDRAATTSGDRTIPPGTPCDDRTAPVEATHGGRIIPAGARADRYARGVGGAAARDIENMPAGIPT
jgi:hypothetical protein